MRGPGSVALAVGLAVAMLAGTGGASPAAGGAEEPAGWPGGRVLEAATGAPVEGAVVSLLETGRVVGRTGEDGSFGLGEGGAAGGALVIRAPGMATVVVEIPAPGEGGAAGLTVELERAGTVELALEAAGEEEIGLWSAGPRVWVPGERFRSLVDGSAGGDLWKRRPGVDGVLRWEDLGPGVYAFELWDSRGRSVGVPVFAVVAPGSFDRFEVPVGSVTLGGTIRGLPSGSAGVTRVILHGPGYAGAAVAELGPAGDAPDAVDFLAEAAPVGPWHVTVDLEGEGWTAALAAGVVEAGDGEGPGDVELELATAWLEGTVVDPSGAPVAGAVVHVSDAGRQVGCSARTGADGSWRCPVPGDRPLAVLARHEAVGVTEITAAPRSGTMAPLLLHPGRRLEGCLRVPEGSSPAGAAVALAPSRHGGFRLRAASDGEGRFVFENVPPGPLTLLALPADRELSVALAVVEADAEGELPCLEAGRAGLAVAPGIRQGGAGGWDLRGSPVLDGVEAGDLFLNPGRGGLCTAPGAGCLLLRLPEGRHAYRWRDASGEVAAETRPFTVYPGELTVFSTRAR